MESLLFLTHRIPYPPNKGDKVRSFNMLKQFARNYRVHLGTFIDDEEDWRYLDEVRAYCGATQFTRLTPRRAKLRSLPALLNGAPLSVPYYHDAGMQRWVDETLRDEDVERVVVFSGAMAQYVCGPRYRSLRRVVDFVDVDSDKWTQFAASQRWPMSWVYRREGRVLLDYERTVADEFDASVFVSAQEVDLFNKLAPHARSVLDIHNGVDTDYFSPERAYADPYQGCSEVVVFTGAMDYWANVDAVSGFAHEVWPLVRARHPNARFAIVGARPSVAVQQLASLAGVEVVGAVHDIRPYLAHAALSVAPLRIARGVQNKVLEAMAMAKSVVATPQAADGIRAQVGKELIVAESAAEFSQQVVAVLEQSAPDTARAARERVLQDYSWEENLRQFEVLLERRTEAVHQSVDNIAARAGHH